jgi:hypothetical protein
MPIVRAAGVFLGLGLLLSLAVCSRNADKPRDVKVGPAGAYEGAVAFEIRPVHSTSASRLWLATYAAAGKTAKFRIELGPGLFGDDEDKTLHVSFGKGRFLSEPGSDASVFLEDLKKALEARTLPNKVVRVTSLPFEFAILGEDQSRTSEGGFNKTPPGHWTAMKIFLADGEGEVFLNLNTASNKAEFSIKDSDYGDIVLAQLAKVL